MLVRLLTRPSKHESGLAACGRIWEVCSPDVGTPLCSAGGLIFITATQLWVQDNRGLGWRRGRETKVGKGENVDEQTESV